MSHELCSRFGCGWICEPSGKAGLLFWLIGGSAVCYGLSRAAVVVGKGPMVLALAAVLVAVAVLIVNAIRTSVASTRYGAAVAYALRSEVLGQLDLLELVDVDDQAEVVVDERPRCEDCDLEPALPGLTRCLECDTDWCAAEVERLEDEDAAERVVR